MVTCLSKQSRVSFDLPEHKSGSVEIIGEHMLDFEGMDGPKDTKKLKLNDDHTQYI